MKPDWQNKSYAKNGAPAGPSTTHPKLKLGMTSLHSKIAVANNNMPQTPKPAVRKFADGGAVMTRSDDEIGDTNPRTGKVDPGSYDRRMAQGEKNLQALKDAFNKFTGDKATTSSPMTEEKQPVERFAASKSPEPEKTKTETTTEPSYMKDVRETLTKPKAEPTMTMTEEAPVTQSAKAPKTESKSSISSTKAERSSVEKPAKSRVSRTNDIGQSQVDVENRAREIRLRASAPRRPSVTDTGDETSRIMSRTETKFVPGFGYVDKEGTIIRGQKSGASSGPSIGDAMRSADKSMTDAGTRFLKSKMDRGETLTRMEAAQAKRAGLM